MIDYKALALKANRALLDGQSLVLETVEEKMAVRSYAEFQYAWERNRAEYRTWLGLHGDSPV